MKRKFPPLEPDVAKAHGSYVSAIRCLCAQRTKASLFLGRGVKGCFHPFADQWKVYDSKNMNIVSMDASNGNAKSRLFGKNMIE